MRNYRVDKINNTVIFEFKYDDEIVSKVKACDYNARWNPEFKHWVVPINDYSKFRIKSVIDQFHFQKEGVKREESIKYDYSISLDRMGELKSLCESKDFLYTPRDYQIECLDYILQRDHTIIADDVGLGKCEYVKNRVFTPSGRQEIGTLRVGDFVIGSNGKPTKVLAVHPQKELKKIYRVTFNDNTSVLVSGDHLFNVRADSKNSKYYTLSVDQMLDEDLVISRKGERRNKNKVYSTKTYYKPKGRNKWRVPIVDTIEFSNNEPLPIDPYILGIILGDGHIDKGGIPYVDINKDDFVEIFKGVDFKECVTADEKRKASLGSLKESIKGLGLEYKLSHEKFIPSSYKYSSIDSRVSILQGLLDSDGYCSKVESGLSSGVFYYSTSKSLANDVSEIVQSLGGVARISYKHPKYKYKGESLVGKKCYIVNIKLPFHIVPFRLSRKAKLIKKSSKYTLSRYIKDISFERCDESVCISVEAEDRLYVTENGIVTHNTFEAIIAAEVQDKFPCLVVVPASVKYNWAEKWDEITKGRRKISIIESNKDNDWDADVVIINYDILGKKQGTGATVRFPELKSTKWNMLISDESHMLKSKSSQRFKAFKMISHKDLSTLLLTGTPTMNKPIELWNLLRLVYAEKVIVKDWMQFITRYCGGYKGKFGWVTDGATNTIELNKKLRDTCYIRREKRDVLKELPNVTKQILNAPISNMRKYKKAVDDFIKYVREYQGEEKAEKAQEAEHLVAIGAMRKLSAEGKVKFIEQYLKDWKELEKGKLLVFGIHKEGLEYLSKKFKCDLIAGGVSSKKKQEIVKDFQVNKDVFLFANMQSAGTGVDGLQNVCSNMVIFELPWRPSDLVQSIGRLDRSGQKEPVTITFILSEDTIDKDMWEMLSEKEAVTEAVNKGIDVERTRSGLKTVIRKILKNNKV